MTLIASATNHGHPFIMSDVLITSKTGMAGVMLPYRPIRLVSKELLGLAYKPLRLLQKLYVIQPNICMCVAGPVNLLNPFIKDFKEYCKQNIEAGKKRLNLMDVAEFLKIYDESSLKEIACGISVVQDLGEGLEFIPQIHVGKWTHVNSKDFEDVAASGSGASQYLEHVEWHNSVSSSHEPGALEYAKQMTFSFIAKLMAKESRTLKSLEKQWGAFIETSFYNGHEFEKVGEVVFVVCDAVCDDKGNMSIPFPRLFIYSQYQGNVLYLTAMEPKDVKYIESMESIEFSSTNVTRKLFDVEEINPAPTIKHLHSGSNLSFTSNQVAMGILIDVGLGAHLPVGLFSEGRDVSVTFVDKKHFNFIWPVHLHENMASQVKSMYLKIKDQLNVYSRD